MGAGFHLYKSVYSDYMTNQSQRVDFTVLIAYGFCSQKTPDVEL